MEDFVDAAFAFGGQAAGEGSGDRLRGDRAVGLFQEVVDGADLLQVVAGPAGLAVAGGRGGSQLRGLQLGALGQLVAQLGQLVVGGSQRTVP